MRQNRIVLVLVTLLLMGSQISLPAQTGATDEWEILRPEGEEFSIMMPKGSTSEAGEQQYHKMVLKNRLYLSGAKSGPLFVVASMSGIKSNPAVYSDFQRLNSYVDAFKDWFPEKVRTKETPIKLTLAGDKVLNGHAGREYQVTIADLSGSAQVFATRKRFYAVVILNSKKDEALRDRFLSSFVLPEKVNEPPASAAKTNTTESTAATPANPPVDTPAKRATASDQKTSPIDSQKTESDVGKEEPKAADDAGDGQKETGEKKRGPINGGVLNNKALYMPKPDYPPEAASAKAAGTVVVQITIDESGGVIAAKAVSGHPTLLQACVNAALQARFSPTTMMGEPVKVTGVLTYSFAH